MIVLALDTCLNACGAAVTDGERVLATRSEPMERGQQERLPGLVAETMGEAGLAFADLDRIGVTTGPGSFTGLRGGVAFAKGLGLALGVPVVGVGALEALAGGRSGRVAAVIDARNGAVYLQAFESGIALVPPERLSLEVAVARLEGLGEGWTLIGSAAADLPIDALERLDPPGADPALVAHLAARATDLSPPRPLYLREAYA